MLRRAAPADPKILARRVDTILSLRDDILEIAMDQRAVDRSHLDLNYITRRRTRHKDPISAALQLKDPDTTPRRGQPGNRKINNRALM